MARAATSKLKVNPAIGTLPVLQYCSLDQLLIDETYQRSLEVAPSQSLIRKIAMYWDWGLCQPLFVARRSDGNLYVVDGQHRLAAARLREDIWQLPCVVSHFESSAEEAASFVALNQQRRPLNRMQIFKAALAAGDQEARLIQSKLEDAGLWIGSSPDLTVQKPGAIICLRGLEECLRQFGSPTLGAALEVLAQSFKGQVLRYSGSIFPGIAAIVADEVKADPDFETGERFLLMTEMVGGASQSEWYQEIGAKTAIIPTRRLAAAALFKDAWAECTAEALDEAA